MLEELRRLMPRESGPSRFRPATHWARLWRMRPDTAAQMIRQGLESGIIERGDCMVEQINGLHRRTVGFAFKAGARRAK